ncbi:MAG: hypothetical protein KY439_04785, partial [Actinobacteria bacterium]|nr:hypothetical protein [Actinomycetota bacterium]
RHGAKAWLGPPLLATVLAVVVAWAVGYYRTVAVPHYQWLQLQRARRPAKAVTTAASVGEGPQPRPLAA